MEKITKPQILILPIERIFIEFTRKKKDLLEITPVNFNESKSLR